MSRSSSAFEIIVNSAAFKIVLLRLQPCTCPATYITGSDPLRDHACKAQTAGMAKDSGIVSSDPLAELNTFPHGLFLARRSFAKRFLRSSRGSGRKSWPPHLHHVLGNQDGLCLPLARAKRLEIGRVVGAHDNHLAVQDCALDRQRRDRVRMRVNAFE